MHDRTNKDKRVNRTLWHSTVIGSVIEMSQDNLCCVHESVSLQTCKKAE